MTLWSTAPAPWTPWPSVLWRLPMTSDSSVRARDAGSESCLCRKTSQEVASCRGRWIPPSAKPWRWWLLKWWVGILVIFNQSKSENKQFSSYFWINLLTLLNWSIELTNSSIDWTFSRLIDRLIDWSIDLSIDWLIDWLIDCGYSVSLIFRYSIRLRFLSVLILICVQAIMLVWALAAATAILSWTSSSRWLCVTSCSRCVFWAMSPSPSRKTASWGLNRTVNVSKNCWTSRWCWSPRSTITLATIKRPRLPRRRTKSTLLWRRPPLNWAMSPAKILTSLSDRKIWSTQNELFLAFLCAASFFLSWGMAGADAYLFRTIFNFLEFRFWSWCPG